jgi:DNA (cytosine-5)-methyltransferase 1
MKRNILITKDNMIKVASDFSGVGAFNQALKRLGIEYNEIFACDMDKYARQTFIHNYGEPKYYPTNVYEREIPTESLDIYMTSPPCQAFSLAGKRLGKNDKRGILFFNSLEFIEKNKPRFFIFENVKGLLSDDGGKTFSEWVNFLGGKSVNGLPVLFPYDDSVDYHLYWKVLNAKHHGVPQNRERVFLIGIRDDKDNNFSFPAEEHLTKRLKDVLESEVNEKYFLSEKMVNYISKDRKGNNNLIVNREIANTLTCCMKNQQRSTQDNYIDENLITFECNQGVLIGYYRTDEGFRWRKDGNSPAIMAMMRDTWNEKFTGQNPPIINKSFKIRRLTPRECFRLMDFPDTFTWPVSDSQAYKQAGNSIVVNVLYKILKNLSL